MTTTTTMPESPASPPRATTKRPRHGHDAAPSLPDEVIVDHILTRVPAADAVRFRAVCRNWRAALTSDHFTRSHQTVRATAAKPPEIVFFAPGAAAGSTAFYSSRLYNSTTPQNDGSSPASATELVTVSDLRATDLVMSGGCHGLTLLFEPGESAYHVINLSTGEHVSLPPCAWANRAIPYGPYVLSSAGLGFHAAPNEHKVVRLFEDGWTKRPRCEVHGLSSGEGWRPIAGEEVPRRASPAGHRCSSTGASTGT
ncbi:hypothetical protein HU200_006325 [Digitaria exilis]|uniref:F-box domain-containing protein n=1 Tax=Digitaria exilis TaxID=1010633 RepID=A0A835KS01_9POAL|nr:hypothetical protein HU200_006325 [Digitaria exilis]